MVVDTSFYNDVVLYNLILRHENAKYSYINVYLFLKKTWLDL